MLESRSSKGHISDENRKNVPTESVPGSMSWPLQAPHHLCASSKSPAWKEVDSMSYANPIACQSCFHTLSLFPTETPVGDPSKPSPHNILYLSRNRSKRVASRPIRNAWMKKAGNLLRLELICCWTPSDLWIFMVLLTYSGLNNCSLKIHQLVCFLLNTLCCFLNQPCLFSRTKIMPVTRDIRSTASAVFLQPQSGRGPKWWWLVFC